MEVGFIPTRRGGKTLVLNDYLLRIEKKSPTESRWKCCTESCRFRCKLDEMDNIIHTHGEHSHPPNPAEVEAKRMKMGSTSTNFLKTNNGYTDISFSPVHAQNNWNEYGDNKDFITGPGAQSKSLDIRRQIVEQSTVSRDFMAPAMAAGILSPTFAGNSMWSFLIDFDSTRDPASHVLY